MQNLLQIIFSQQPADHLLKNKIGKTNLFKFIKIYKLSVRSHNIGQSACFRHVFLWFWIANAISFYKKQY